MRLFIITIIMLGWLTMSYAQTKYPKVVIETNYGTMKAILFDDTPNHSEYFLKLVKQGYFNGTLFHRVIQDFVIQGGAQDSRNAPTGAQIGSGSLDMVILPEFRPNHYHRKGAICAPRRGNEENPQKKSDMSQFYIADGETLSTGMLDTMEMAINVPIKNAILRTHYSPMKQELALLKTSDPHAFNSKLDSVLNVVDSIYAAATGKFYFLPDQKQIYSTEGGIPKLDGEYTVYGQVTDGLEVIDKIASLSTDERDRPLTDARIIRIFIDNN